MDTRFFLASLLALAALAIPQFGQDTKPLYRNDFEKAEIGKVPDDFLVLDGAFTVQQQSTNRFLELPGAPLDNFGVLFGPTEKDGVTASARVFASAKGRRFPTFALGLNGAGGYRLQVSPAKMAVELYRGDTLKTSAPYRWEEGHWTHLRLQVQKVGAGWKVDGRVWSEEKPEPNAWIISSTDQEDLPAGRAALFGSPFSGTPIRFDDLVLTRSAGK